MVLSFFQVCHHPGNVTTYVINWAERFGPGEDGTPTVLAKGLLSLHKDGSFQVDYNKRPYRGQWSLADQRMSLTAGWLNGGEASVAPVERVETPIGLVYSGGREDSYAEEVYRIGPFRLPPMDTMVKGALLPDRTGRPTSGNRRHGPRRAVSQIWSLSSPPALPVLALHARHGG